MSANFFSLFLFSLSLSLTEKFFPPKSITIDLFIKLKWDEPRLNITNATREAMKDQLILDKNFDKRLWCPSVFFKNGIRGDMYLEKSPMSYFEIVEPSTVQMTQRWVEFVRTQLPTF